jgi:biopolymer transport protein ExbD
MNARRRLRRVQHEDIGLQIAPMIDVTLLLLFFFMLSGKLSENKRTQNINLPAIYTDYSDDGGTGPKEMEVVNVDALGALFAGDRPLDTPALAAYLRTRFEKNPALKLHLRADAVTPAAKIKELARVAAEAGAIEIVYGIRH